MTLAPSLRDRTRRAINVVGGKALWGLERSIARASSVGNPAFFDPGLFDWIPELERSWRAMRAELERVLEHRDRLPAFQEISTDQKAITTDDRWKTYFLYGFGYRAEGNCARCPETARLVERVPGMKTAFFSILSPDKHIPEHRGLWKGFIRYHLGLIVPEPRARCRIRVGDEVRHWEEGKSLVFDDTYPHEVWNDTEGLRAVLFLDVVRPLRFPVNVLNDAIIAAVSRTPYVQDAKRNQQAWETARYSVPGDR